MRQPTRFVLAALVFIGSVSATEAKEKKIEFTDVKKQTVEFIRYYKTIQLTKEQEAVKREALSPLPAACCSSNSAYTCCCICNLSRTVWGLTAYLITERDASVEEIQSAVREWIRFVNPEGFSGDACFKGGCMRSFEKNGCGGMQASRVVWE
jgi:hypothetical protein